MASLSSPPFIPVEGIHNFRSIGGYLTTATILPTKANNDTSTVPVSVPSPGPVSVAILPITIPHHSPHHALATTRPNILFRSAEPSRITPGGIQTLHSLKISTIFDLRSQPELEKLSSRMPVVHIPGIQRIHAPIFHKDTDYSPAAIALRYRDYTHADGAEGFVRAYADILESGAPAYRRVFEFLRDRGGLPEEKREACLVHCTAGKDRTGVLVALVLALVGVEDRIIAEEYALTEAGLAGWKEQIVDFLLKDLEMHGGREGVERMISARATNMTATLEMIKARYGGAEGYLKQKCGFSDQDLDIIRGNLVENG